MDAAILAGGRARRLGGQNKRALLVGPATFLPLRATADGEQRVPAERYEIPVATATAINKKRGMIT